MATKSAYKYIKENVRNNIRDKLVAWRRQNSVQKIDKPTDLSRARNLGYKDKKGFVVARVKIKRGGRKKTRPKRGRRSKRQTNRKNLKMSYQWVCELRASKKFKNLEVLNSYQIAKDGKHYFYEVILIDPERPEIKKDKNFKWITEKTNKKRTERGLTSAGKKSRGLRSRHPANKSRPSVRSGKRRGK